MIYSIIAISLYSINTFENFLKRAVYIDILQSPCIAWERMKSCSKFLRNLVTTAHFTDRTESLNPCTNWKSNNFKFFCWTKLIIGTILKTQCLDGIQLEIFSRGSRHRCSSKQVFLKMDFRPATLLKKDSNTGVFLWNFWN